MDIQYTEPKILPYSKVGSKFEVNSEYSADVNASLDKFFVNGEETDYTKVIDEIVYYLKNNYFLISDKSGLLFKTPVTFPAYSGSIINIKEYTSNRLLFDKSSGALEMYLPIDKIKIRENIRNSLISFYFSGTPSNMDVSIVEEEYEQIKLKGKNIFKSTVKQLFQNTFGIDLLDNINFRTIANNLIYSGISNTVIDHNQLLYGKTISEKNIRYYDSGKIFLDVGKLKHKAFFNIIFTQQIMPNTNIPLVTGLDVAWIPEYLWSLIVKLYNDRLLKPNQIFRDIKRISTKKLNLNEQNYYFNIRIDDLIVNLKHRGIHLTNFIRHDMCIMDYGRSGKIWRNTDRINYLEEDNTPLKNNTHQTFTANSVMGSLREKNFICKLIFNTKIKKIPPVVRYQQNYGLQLINDLSKITASFSTMLYTTYEIGNHKLKCLFYPFDNRHLKESADPDIPSTTLKDCFQFKFNNIGYAYRMGFNSGVNVDLYNNQYVEKVFLIKNNIATKVAGKQAFNIKYFRTNKHHWICNLYCPVGSGLIDTESSHDYNRNQRGYETKIPKFKRQVQSEKDINEGEIFSKIFYGKGLYLNNYVLKKPRHQQNVVNNKYVAESFQYYKSINNPTLLGYVAFDVNSSMYKPVVKGFVVYEKTPDENKFHFNMKLGIECYDTIGLDFTIRHSGSFTYGLEFNLRQEPILTAINKLLTESLLQNLPGVVQQFLSSQVGGVLTGGSTYIKNYIQTTINPAGKYR